MKMSSQIRMQADDFFKSYKVLEKNFDTESLAIMGPSIVCLAFSVELYLKDVHFTTTGKAPRGHNIYKLFEKLPPAIKQEIFAHKSISQNPFITRGGLFSLQSFNRSYNPYDGFIEQMKRISDGFEKWRYSYESATLQYDSSFSLALIDALKAVSDRIRHEQYRNLRTTYPSGVTS